MTAPNLYYETMQSPPELMRALDIVLDTFARIPDRTPMRWMDLCELVLLNIFSAITWDSVEQRTVVAGQLYDRLIRDLAAHGLPDSEIAGHA